MITYGAVSPIKVSFNYFHEVKETIVKSWVISDV